MLEHLNKINVRPGDGILVPAGQAHATGAGVFLVEVQEPTDFSILLEWSVTTATRDESHLGLGFDVVLPAVSHQALPAPEPVHVGLDDRAADLLRGLPPGSRPVLPGGRRGRRRRAGAARFRRRGRARGRQPGVGRRRPAAHPRRGAGRARRHRRLGRDRAAWSSADPARPGRRWASAPHRQGGHDHPRGVGAARRPGHARGRPAAPLRLQRPARRRPRLPPRRHGQPAGRAAVARGAPGRRRGPRGRRDHDPRRALDAALREAHPGRPPAAHLRRAAGDADRRARGARRRRHALGPAAAAGEHRRPDPEPVPPRRPRRALAAHGPRAQARAARPRRRARSPP